MLRRRRRRRRDLGALALYRTARERVSALLSTAKAKTGAAHLVQLEKLHGDCPSSPDLSSPMRNESLLAAKRSEGSVRALNTNQDAKELT